MSAIDDVIKSLTKASGIAREMHDMAADLPKKYEFPDCMHEFCAAMHMLGVDPGKLIIALPQHDWWTLYSKLQLKIPGIMTFDGRGEAPREFRYMGIKFRAQTEAAWRRSPGCRY